jgi:hypothetical protein
MGWRVFAWQVAGQRLFYVSSFAGCQNRSLQTWKKYPKEGGEIHGLQ